MGRSGLMRRIATDACATMSAKRFHSGSKWKFQCERLFGSFHNTTASTIQVVLPFLGCLVLPYEYGPNRLRGYKEAQGWLVRLP